MDSEDQKTGCFRKLAEDQVGSGKIGSDDQSRLIRELRIHQRELELQQEALEAVQEELQEKNRQFSLLFHQAPVPYLLVNRSGMILMANQAAARLLHSQSDAGLTGHSVAEYIQSGDRKRFNHHLDQVQTTGSAQLADLGLHDIGLSGGPENQRWCSIDSRFHDSGQEGWIFMVLREITSQKNLEDDLILAQQEALKANRLKNLFLANTSHELRTALHSIAHLLADSTISPETRDSVIQNTVQSTLRVINDILDFTAIEEGTLATSESNFTLEHIVHQIRSSYAGLCRDKGLTLECRVQAPDKLELSGDLQRILQILTNLVQNALDYTDRGRIDVIADYKPITSFQGEVVFEIRDSGRGLSSDELHTIWLEPFDESSRYKKNTNGLGIGLPLCKRLARLLGGQLYLSSNQGLGTSAFFSIPLYHGDPPAGQPAPSPTQGNRHRKKILVVEDNELNRMVLVHILQQLGYANILGAEDGREALDLLSEHGDTALVLMDISMPRMDGLEATRLIRQGRAGNSDIPIVAISAHTMTGDEETFLSAGMNAHIAKPFTRHDVETVASRFLGAGSGSQPGSGKTPDPEG
ncbi:response regulator [Spirochaeta lutea]|uniref:histidine kinase n=1 Tax=Spirochaeta lutea TaxID=1480694 RepID=A0A098QZG7_9SPIO|nr:response regulator [Spirochaeta lutea]KGE71862.1 hypothetical protein DC28_08535 [Spirochaeta lutea]